MCVCVCVYIYIYIYIYIHIHTHTTIYSELVLIVNLCVVDCLTSLSVALTVEFF